MKKMYVWQKGHCRFVFTEGHSFLIHTMNKHQRCDPTRSGTTYALVVQVIPILYGIATRIAFVSLPLEAVKRGFELHHVGLLIGLYQLMRAFSNYIISTLGQRVILVLVPISSIGFILNISGDSSYMLWTYSIFVGLGEVVVCLQIRMLALPSIQQEFSLVAASLRAQYGFVSLGAALGFAVAGALYAKIGFWAVCIFGLLCTLVEIALVVYVWVVASSETIDLHETRASDQLLASRLLTGKSVLAHSNEGTWDASNRPQTGLSKRRLRQVQKSFTFLAPTAIGDSQVNAFADTTGDFRRSVLGSRLRSLVVGGGGGGGGGGRGGGRREGRGAGTLSHLPRASEGVAWDGWEQGWSRSAAATGSGHGLRGTSTTTITNATPATAKKEDAVSE
jgi:hypothetical protein